MKQAAYIISQTIAWLLAFTGLSLVGFTVNNTLDCINLPAGLFLTILGITISINMSISHTEKNTSEHEQHNQSPTR